MPIPPWPKRFEMTVNTHASAIGRAAPSSICYFGAMSSVRHNLWLRASLGILCTLGFGNCGGAPEPPIQRPNLLFISIDTLRADALGTVAAGLSNVKENPTPFLDEFMLQCVNFEQAWSHTPKTAPSHMTMFTGLPPRVHGIGNQRSSGNPTLGLEARTLAEVLQSVGYRTGAVTSGGNVKGYLGFERGFEIYDEKPKQLPAKLADARKWLASVAGAAAGVEQADSASEQEPWFFFFHTYAVHDPYLPPAKYRKRYTEPSYAGDIIGDPLELRAAIYENGEDLAEWASSHAKIEANFWERVDQDDPADLAHLQNLYTAGVAGMDRELRLFIEWMEESGLLENTLIVLTSDHGEEFGEHGMTRHHQLWNESLHVPLLVRLPDAVHGGTTISAPVRHMDLLPSILEMMEVPDPGTILGESWAGWIKDPDVIDSSRVILGEHRFSLDDPLNLWSLRAEGSLLISLHNAEEPLFFAHTADSAIGVSGATVPEPGSADAAKRDRLLDMWKREVGRFQAEGSRFGAGEGSELDDETRAELEALGYL